jgi:8-amino-7-oxononanoate synthase
VIDLDARLDELRERGLRRRTRVIEGAQGSRVTVDGREALLLCSNDYLGLAADERVRTAAAEAALHCGAGAGASRLVSGTMEVHELLERRLAAFERQERALLFGSGYLANAGIVSALAGRGEVVFSDELNHASIVDGCRLSRAEVFVYRHADLEHLAWGLKEAGPRASLVVTDSVFSMDGDIAPLTELVALAEAHGARLMVDEAHGTGTLGPGGRGAVAAAGLERYVDVVVGTLGKALGAYGAYACGSATMVEYLLNRARPFIFSTAPPPPAAAAAYAALEILEQEPERVAALASRSAALRGALAADGWPDPGSRTHIIPLVIGTAEAAVAACEAALERGVFAQAIRPPTVPEGTSRLRLAVMATHEPADLRRAARVLGEVAADAPRRHGPAALAV